MGTVPTPRTWVPAERVTATLLNTEIRDILQFLLSTKPLFVAVQAVSQPLLELTWTAITFTTEVLDRDNGHSTTVNTSRYTAKTPGYYRVNVTGSSLQNSGRFHVAIHKNGVEIPSGTGAQGDMGGAPSSVSEAIVFLNGITDYIELYVMTAEAGNTQTTVTSRFANRITVEWMSN